MNYECTANMIFGKGYETGGITSKMHHLLTTWDAHFERRWAVLNL